MRHWGTRNKMKLVKATVFISNISEALINIALLTFFLIIPLLFLYLTVNYHISVESP